MRCAHRRVVRTATTAVLSLLPLFSSELFAQPRPSSGGVQAHEVASSPPRLVRKIDAAYPPERLRRGEGAVVHLQLDLDDAGRVTSVSLVQSSGDPAFDESAAAAAREFEFEPARRDGHAVASRI